MLPSRPTGLGLREVPVYDAAGNYRFLVCGTGIMENGARASAMAIKPFSDTSYCMKTANDSGAAIVTETKYMVSSGPGCAEGGCGAASRPGSAC